MEGAARGAPASSWLSLGFSAFTWFSFSCRLSHPLLLPPWLDSSERESGLEACRAWDALRLHIPLLGSETCPVMCAKPGVGRLEPACLGEQGGASGPSDKGLGKGPRV